MEEILASIRRIISEEEENEGRSGPVLDLTQPADEPGDDLLVFDAEPEPAAAAAPKPSPRPAQPVRPAAPAAPAVAPPRDEPANDSTLISPPTVQQATGALTRLAGALRIADTQGQTLEGVVRELLTPMLKEWLDQNLPAIVEAKVEAELERLARLVR
ncbi:MAG: DUF2497 domain-containing protein [Hydrogenophilaceae bacterium]|jgi:hypothetical protein|nr:DUF2497 domain-containing protein [Hydrogenophilaceae bacterium]